MGGADLFQLAKKSVFKRVVAVGDDDFLLLNKLAQRLAFAGVARCDGRVAGTLAQHRELQMKFGGAVLIAEPECPVHAWEGWQQGAVHEFEFVSEMGEPRVAPRSLVFCPQIEEHSFEQFGIENSLRL